MNECIQPPIDEENNKIIQIDKEIGKKIIKKQRLIFVPPISSKVIISFIFCEYYLSYAAYNKIDTPYIKKSICLIVFMFFYTYYLSLMTPGTQTNVDKFFNNSKEIQYLKNHFWKNCQFCNSKKFIRSSHCRTCQKCILFRDHHCPYIANCIGFNNVQHFLNVLFWGMYAIAYYNITCIKFFLKKDNTYLNDGSLMPKIIKYGIIIDFIVNIFFFNGMFYMFIRTFISIYNNFPKLEQLKVPNIKKVLYYIIYIKVKMIIIIIIFGI